MAAGNSPSITGFDPRSVPGMALWLDAADASTLTFSSGSNVSAWRDKSGNGRDAIQPNVSKQPLLQTGSLNGMPSLKWDGIDDRLDGALPYPTSGQTTLFIVYEITTNRQERVFDINENGYGNFGSPWNTTPTSEVILWLGGASYPTNALYTQTAPTLGLKHYSVIYNGTSSGIWRFGNSMALTGSGANATPTGTLYTLGNQATSTNGDPFSGRMAEIILYSGNLTTSQRQQIEGYLAWKWGLNTSLLGGVTMPTQIPGCALWLDAADSSTITRSGNNITSWTNKSSYGGTLSGGTFLANQYTENGVSFVTGPANVSMSLSMTYTSVYKTVFMVVNIGAGGSGVQQQFLGSGAGSGAQVYSWNSDLEFNRNGLGFTYTLSPTNFFNKTSLVALTVSTALYGIFINGTSQNATVNTTQTFPTGSTTQTVGGGAAPVNFAEMIVFDGDITTTQRQAVEGYLATKWNLRASLPTTHPLYTGIAIQPFAITRPFVRPFQPIDIPGCALWLDAADAASLTFSSGSNVSVWRDKSGNARDATSWTGTATKVGNAIYFNGSAALQTSLSASTNVECGFVVFSVNANGVANTFIGSQNAEGGRQFRVNPTLQTVKQNIAGVLYTTGTTIVNNTTCLGEYTNDGTTLTHYLNGVFDATATSIAYSSGTTTSIGGRFGPSEFMAGNIYEIIIFNTSLTTSQRQQVEGYLAWKWGLNAQLTGVPLNPQWQSGLALWFDAADSSTIGFSSGINVNLWRDKSGNGYSVVQPTTASQPTYATNLLNGLPGIQLSSAGYLYQLGSNMSNFTASSSTTVFIVAKNGSSYPTSGWNIINTIWFNGVGTGRYHLSFGENATNGTTLYATGGARIGQTTAVPLGSNAIIGFTVSPSGNAINVNGTFTSYGGSTATSAVDSTWFIFGDARGGLVADVNIYEFIGFSNVLTTSQRQGIETYLARKWGLTVPTSTPHPYFRLPSSSVAVFSPTMISGCALWLDAADSSTIGFSSGSNVSVWRDKSGNARNATVSSNAFATWSNTTSGLQFNNSFYTTPYTADPPSETAFLVFRYTGTNNLDMIMVGAYTSGREIAVYNGDYVTAGLIKASIAWLPLASFTPQAIQLITTQSSSSATSVSVNGGTATTGGGVTFTSGNVTTLGRENGTGGGYVGFIYELILFSNVLTPVQRQQVEGYLAQKWSISIPTSHPYTKFAPASI